MENTHNQDLIAIRIPNGKLTHDCATPPLEEGQHPPRAAETHSYLLYGVHLLDGTVLEVLEDLALRSELTLPERIANHEDKDLLYVGDPFNGFHFVPRRSILYVSQADVPQIEDIICPFRLFNMPSKS